MPKSHAGISLSQLVKYASGLMSIDANRAEQANLSQPLSYGQLYDLWFRFIYDKLNIKMEIVTSSYSESKVWIKCKRYQIKCQIQHLTVLSLYKY